MILRPPISTLADTLVPYTTLFRSLPEIFDLFLDFDILAFPECFDVREIVAIGREEVADEAIVELDRVEERRGDWDVAAREFHSDRRAVEMSSRVHVDLSHDTFLRRRISHGHCLGPAHLALAPAHEAPPPGTQGAGVGALFE